MAVVKSFDLSGNKQSFANWISNLSPCETPFTSMIGKEGIDQASYSWQTDRLSPAIYSGVEEGSEASFTSRGSTEVHHNYTSILRKVVKVSATAKSVALYGRGSEVEYQMKKAGCEMKRDLEFMMLHNLNGNPALANRASQFAGFEGLVGGLNMHDNDTGAVVHKTIQVSNGLFTKFGADEIFDLTYNLYLAGARANKIMFHPKHAPSFASLINSNFETPHVHRLFDGLSTEFNTQVSRIKCPLGRYYDLVPNRYMPVDKIYFFHEDDWTQMILRAPAVSPLGKTDSSSKYLMEMEVGLRHRHPFASGILAIHEANISNDLILDRTEFTAAVGDVLPVTSNVLVDGVSEPGTLVYWHTSHPDIVSFQSPTTEVAGSMGEANNFLQAGTRQGNATVWTVSKGIKSVEYLVSVRAPSTELTVSEKNPAVGSTVQLTAQVNKVDGTPAGSGVRVDWYKSPESGLTFSEAFTSTDANGVATVDAVINAPETSLIQCSVGRYNSNPIYLNYVPVIASLDLDITPDTFLVGENTQVVAQAIDHEGNPIEGAVINFVNSNPGIATLSAGSGTTDDQGIVEVDITGIAVGSSTLRASSGNVVVSGYTPYYVGTGASMVFEFENYPGIVGEPVTYKVTLTGKDGSPLRGVPVTFSTNPALSGFVDGNTDNNGVYQNSFTPLVSGSWSVTARSEGFGISKTVDLVVDASVLLHKKVESTSIFVGDNLRVEGVVTSSSGLPVKGVRVKAMTTPSWPTAITDLVTDSNGKVVYSLPATQPGVYEIKLQIAGSVSLETTGTVINVNPVP